jgi:bromodomain adjacent to zinc finger domain protein 1A
VLHTDDVRDSRDRLAFSKSILKRYIRECVQRDALIASPWIVKPLIAVAFGIPTHQSEEVEEKNKQIREGKLAKRRKVSDSPPSHSHELVLTPSLPD